MCLHMEGDAQNNVQKSVSYLHIRDGVYYFVRRVPIDVKQYYASNRISFSLKTKSFATAHRASKSIVQRLDDYWLGLRLQDMDIPAISVLKDVSIDSNAGVTTISEALDLYLKLKGAGKDKVFIRTANRNEGYVIKVLVDRPTPSYSSSDAAIFGDWLINRGMGIKTVKRVFSSEGYREYSHNRTWHRLCKRLCQNILPSRSRRI